MKLTLIFFLSLMSLLCLSTISTAQSSLKMERADEKDIQATVDLFFEGLYDGNMNKMTRAVWQDARLISTFVNKQGEEQTRTSSIKDFLESASKPREEKWNEKIWDVEIESEGRLAQVIMEYAFFLDDKFIHCGANAMQLIKMDGQWKIVALTDTRMKRNCDQKEIKRFQK